MVDMPRRVIGFGPFSSLLISSAGNLPSFPVFSRTLLLLTGLGPIADQAASGSIAALSVTLHWWSIRRNG
jgi:hypothetical protein